MGGLLLSGPITRLLEAMRRSTKSETRIFGKFGPAAETFGLGSQGVWESDACREEPPPPRPTSAALLGTFALPDAMSSFSTIWGNDTSVVAHGRGTTREFPHEVTQRALKTGRSGEREAVRLLQKRLLSSPPPWHSARRPAHPLRSQSPSREPR